jgi:hypothetical protein
LDAGKALKDTSTGAGLHEETLALKVKKDAEILALKEEMEKVARERHAELLAKLEEEHRKMDAQRKKMEDDLENLKSQMPSAAQKLSVRRRNDKTRLRVEGCITYLACKKSTILRRMSVSLTASRESSKLGVSTNTTQRKRHRGRYLIASECLNKLKVVHSAICFIHRLMIFLIISLGLVRDRCKTHAIIALLATGIPTDETTSCLQELRCCDCSTQDVTAIQMFYMK